MFGHFDIEMYAPCPKSRSNCSKYPQNKVSYLILLTFYYKKVVTFQKYFLLLFINGRGVKMRFYLIDEMRKYWWYYS